MGTVQALVTITTCNLKKNKRTITHINVILVTNPEYLLNSQNALHKNGPQLVSDPRQQEAKERDAKYGIKNAKDLPAFRAWSYVSITCQKNKESTKRKKEK